MFLFRHIFLTIFVFALTEVVVLSQVSDLIGWGWTILGVVSTAMLGSALLRHQGFDTWMRINKKLQKGEMPGAEMIEGVLLLIGGALLITPGFITDAVGFMFLLPMTRQGLARWAIGRGMMEAMAQKGSANGNVWVYQQTSGQTPPGFGSPPPFMNDVPRSSERVSSGDIIEGEVVRKDD
ncbi:hypothetical protein A9Q99_03390 [Gammaproteobacteria bacterium 45_16_T64]|nr:hypothetical protein A9Q99_03390 [Gammaproteobacteria bacterium 45_16_T64]